MPVSQEDGSPVDKMIYPSASTLKFDIETDSMLLQADCNQCSSKGLKELPNILSILERAGAMDALSISFVSIFEGVIEGDYIQSQIDRTLTEAANLCSHGSE